MPIPGFLLKSFRIILFLFLISTSLQAQIIPAGVIPVNHKVKCGTMEAISQAISRDPSILDKWRKQGEERYQEFLKRKSMQRGILSDTIVIPVVFHLVDDATHLGWVTDRSVYDQVEILNEAYNGVKLEKFKMVIPEAIYNRKGNIPLRFVLARRAPDGSLTSGIERRTNTTPDRVSIKSYATGGLDAWDTDKYLNVWVGTFTGDDDGLLGIATFPYITTEGPQGVVIGIGTMPYTSNVSRSYYPAYSEGGTLVHEIGHYFYLYHTFGDSYTCNNNDFRIQAGWPLPAGAGPEGDDTPEEKADSNGNAHYGDPSMNYSDGCTALPEGEMYGSFMNYFDDRALFMFSNGHRKRVEGCIEYYRTNVANSIGAIAPTSINDVYLVGMTPYGSPERRTYVLNNAPLTAQIRNYGTTTLNNYTVTVMIDGSIKFQQIFNSALLPGEDIRISLGNINSSVGNHVMTVYTSSPNGGADAFTGNDTLQSFFNIVGGSLNAPFTENFSNSAFPPTGWSLCNPNNNGTWSYNSTSGYASAGSASMQNFSMNASGQLDDLISPAINLGSADSSVLSFRYAYAVYDDKDVSTWDGLEIYLSNNDGANYELIYKKTGNALKTVLGFMTTSFTALPTNPEKWGLEKINLTPYIVPGKKMLLKFRGLNAYGNNLYLDDINVSAVVSLDRDVEVTAITNLPTYNCGDAPVPSVTFQTNGKDPLTSLNISYSVDEQPINTLTWTGTLNQNSSHTVNLPALQSLPPGTHRLTVFSSAPNGQPDEAPMNDTLRQMFYVMGNTTNPLTESFEATTFPPNQWVLQQNGNDHSWERNTSAATDGNASSVIRNFNNDMQGNMDNLISPIVGGNAGYDSLFISFDYAYAPGSNYPGGPGDPEDTLEVKITSDCGQTFNTIFKKFGNEMVTVQDPMDRKNTSFIPNKQDWQNISVFLTPIVNSSDFQVFFTSKGNNRNNVYLDNVKIYGIKVPALLKEKGYLIYPSPFINQFIIRNYEEPVGLQSIQIYNSIGQLVWQQAYNGNAYKQIFVNGGGWPSGVYTVKMNYTNKKIIDRVMKQ